MDEISVNNNTTPDKLLTPLGVDDGDVTAGRGVSDMSWTATVAMSTDNGVMPSATTKSPADALAGGLSSDVSTSTSSVSITQRTVDNTTVQDITDNKGMMTSQPKVEITTTKMTSQPKVIITTTKMTSWPKVQITTADGSDTLTTKSPQMNGRATSVSTNNGEDLLDMITTTTTEYGRLSTSESRDVTDGIDLPLMTTTPSTMGTLNDTSTEANGGAVILTTTAKQKQGIEVSTTKQDRENVTLALMASDRTAKPIGTITREARTISYTLPSSSMENNMTSQSPGGVSVDDVTTSMTSQASDIAKTSPDHGILLTSTHSQSKDITTQEPTKELTSMSTHVMTSEGSVTSPQDSNIVAIAVGAAVGALAVIALLILIVFLKRRYDDNQRRKKYRDEENVKDYQYDIHRDNSRPVNFDESLKNGAPKTLFRLSHENPVSLEDEVHMQKPEINKNYFKAGLQSESSTDDPEYIKMGDNQGDEGDEEHAGKEEDEEEEEEMERMGPRVNLRDKKSFPMRALNAQSRVSMGPVLLQDEDPSTQNTYDKMYTTHNTFK